MRCQPYELLHNRGCGFYWICCHSSPDLEDRSSGDESDKLTYAGNLESLACISDSPRYQFIQGDICDHALVSKLILDFQPNIIMHLAAESHVDRSIDGPADFIQTNIVGTTVMLECARSYWSNLDKESRKNFAFIISLRTKSMAVWINGAFY